MPEDADSRILEHLSPWSRAMAVERVRSRFPAGWDAASSVPIHARFFARWGRGSFAADEAALPPVARIVHAGRGGATPRLRLYLWLHLLAGDSGDPVRVTTDDWIALLNLASPDTTESRQVTGAELRNAQRRVRRAAAQLEAIGLVDRPRRYVLQLRDPLSGDRWRPPSAREREHYMKERAQRMTDWGPNVLRDPAWFEDDPIALPVNCFTNGVIAVLSATGLAVLLALLDLGASDDWQTLRYKRRVRYGFTKEPWYSGVRELASYGWLSVRSEPRTKHHSVHSYRLHLGRLRGDGHFKTGYAPAWEQR